MLSQILFVDMFDTIEFDRCLPRQTCSTKREKLPAHQGRADGKQMLLLPAQVLWYLPQQLSAESASGVRRGRNGLTALRH